MTRATDTSLSKQSKKQSNRDHHLTFWDDTYREYPQKLAQELFRVAELIRRFNSYEHRMKGIDQNRRENAIAMGVSIKESDEKYSFDAYIKGIPKIIEQMLAYEKEFNVKFGDIRNLDERIAI